ncbi:MAG: 3-deoxy-manno-octulosonate cytidylyltransferase [Flammeovirgaceae bacterium]|nr:3-deoxy-manno-octulosonate cytidylyltransferase [Flammeovirgaceae bacterium]|tara:strand:+ start:462 stop:1187 length:726 start_codon:yes stop_codon:yes gene_type:complete
MKKNFLIIIPARYKSSRLPGKPLIDILGTPMLVRTFNQCRKVTSSDNIIVATDDERISNLCIKNKIKYIMTSKKCLTGTDRVAEVAKKNKAEFYINVQGDEPLCNPSDLKKIINYSKRYPNKVLNGYTKITEKKQFLSSNIPKVVFRKDGRLLYMSRAAIPTTKEKFFLQAWRQVCIYSFPYKALLAFSTKRKKTKLESIEDCELVRFLELGFDVQMISMSNKSIAVDTKQDLIKVKKILK